MQGGGEEEDCEEAARGGGSCGLGLRGDLKALFFVGESK
jgi:hypothetical protein